MHYLYDIIVISNVKQNLLTALDRGVDMHRELGQVESDQEMQRELENALESTKNAMAPYLTEGIIFLYICVQLDFTPVAVEAPKHKERKVGFAGAATVAKVMVSMAQLESSNKAPK